MNARTAVLACILLGLSLVTEARLLLSDVGLTLSKKEAAALVESSRRASQHHPSAIVHDHLKPSKDGKCPYGYVIMGEDSKTGTPRIKDRKGYWCERSDKIHTIFEYQKMHSMDPEGTQKAKDVTDNENPHKEFNSVKSKNVAEEDDSNARAEADKVAAIGDAKTREVLDEADVEFEKANFEDANHSKLKL